MIKLKIGEKIHSFKSYIELVTFLLKSGEYKMEMARILNHQLEPRL